MKFKIVERTERLYTVSYYGIGMVERDVTYYDVYKDETKYNGIGYLDEDWKLVKAFSDLLEAARYKNELEMFLG